MTATNHLREYERLLGSWPGLVGRGELASLPRLVEDSLTLLPLLDGVGTLVDVGSGGGMPGIPLAIARPGLRVTLIEADSRKAAFLVHAAATLGLDLDVRAERAESAGRGGGRESFDVSVSRALAPLAVVAELSLPLVRVGGRMLAMKGERVQGAELSAARTALAELGAGEPAVHAAPSEARPGGVVVEARKLAPTPAAYPRRPGVPAKRPLGRPAGPDVR